MLTSAAIRITKVFPIFSSFSNNLSSLLEGIKSLIAGQIFSRNQQVHWGLEMVIIGLRGKKFGKFRLNGHRGKRHNFRLQDLRSHFKKYACCFDWLVIQSAYTDPKFLGENLPVVILNLNSFRCHVIFLMLNVRVVMVATTF